MGGQSPFPLEVLAGKAGLDHIAEAGGCGLTSLRGDTRPRCHLVALLSILCHGGLRLGYHDPGTLVSTGLSESSAKGPGDLPDRHALT